MTDLAKTITSAILASLKAGGDNLAIYNAVQDALAAQQDGSWQPIETAPKDGSRFLAFEPRGEYQRYECWWRDDFSNWSGWQTDWDNEPNPTHWMPLPAPPAT